MSYVKHIVGFSGGVDSQACAGVVLDQYGPEDVILCNSDAGGNEHPYTVEFVQWYSENVFPVTVIPSIIADMWETPGYAEKRGFDGNAPLDFLTMAKIKGIWPRHWKQFCTQKLKLVPQRRWIRENFNPGGVWEGWDYVRYIGVRADESFKRSGSPESEYDTWFDCEIKRPVLKWSKQQCFDFVLNRGERINVLYTKGFNRVGCAPCINSNKQDIAAWADQFPEMIDKIRKWEHEMGKTFFGPKIPGVNINWIDDVVEWSMTKRGGKEQRGPKLFERPSCESKYGLCE